MEKETYVYRGPGALSLLGVAFVVLKLTDNIDWSWWWVLLPFYIWYVVALVVVGVLFVCLGVLKLLDIRSKRKRKKNKLGWNNRLGT